MPMPLSLARRIDSGRVTIDDLRAEAARVLKAREQRARRVAPRKAPGREKKRAAREERNARTAEVRAACMKRADGKCETCGQPGDERLPLEMHHLLPGRGRRTQEQDVSNCLMVCGMCHAIGHGRILYVGDSLTAWARRNGYTETEKAIRYRIDKALLADPTWPRDADETARLGPDSIPRDPSPLPASRRDAAPTTTGDRNGR